MALGGTLAKFSAALRGCGLQPSDRVAVALSGGPDSLALASLTVWWHGFVRSQQEPLALIVDHRLRPESGAEAAAVAAQATTLGMQARVLAVDWPSAGGVPRLGDKMRAAREARYSLLLRACHELGCSHLLLAHHADDQAETFLLRLMHASGVAGLACMPAVTEKRTELGSVKLVRPLLGLHKADLEAYCRGWGLAYVSDPTNADLAFHRNRIRHLLQQAPQAGPAGPAVSAAEAMAGEASADSADQEFEAAEGGSPIVRDILRLQRRCEAAVQRQQAVGNRVLQRAVLHTSLPEAELPQRRVQLAQPVLPPVQQQAGGGGPSRRRADAQTQHGEQARHWARRTEWDARLQQVAAALRPLRFALLDAACFAGLPEPAALEALSRLLQAVSGSPYPPALHHITRLWQALLPGRLGAAYEGGGCRLRRLPQCGGRYLVCVSSRDRAAAEEHLAELSSSAAGQERKEAVRRDGQWQGQRHHGERQQAAAAGALLDAAAALAEPIAGG